MSHLQWNRFREGEILVLPTHKMVSLVQYAASLTGTIVNLIHI